MSEEETWLPTPEQVAKYTPLLLEFPAAVRVDFGIVLDVANEHRKYQIRVAARAKRHAQ